MHYHPETLLLCTKRASTIARRAPARPVVLKALCGARNTTGRGQARSALTEAFWQQSAVPQHYWSWCRVI